MTFLVEILLPLHDADGNAFPAPLYEELAQKLPSALGVTSFSRSPGKGAEHDRVQSCVKRATPTCGYGKRCLSASLLDQPLGLLGVLVLLTVGGEVRAVMTDFLSLSRPEAFRYG